MELFSHGEKYEIGFHRDFRVRLYIPENLRLPYSLSSITCRDLMYLSSGMYNANSVSDYIQNIDVKKREMLLIQE